MQAVVIKCTLRAQSSTVRASATSFQEIETSLKPGGGKTKGSGWERTCCEILSLWLSKGERKDLICRTVGSGGQFTSSAQRGTIKGLAGDLRAQDGIEAFKFFERTVTECKFWADLELVKFLLQSGELYEAMQKVKKEAEQTEKPNWWLLAKQNNRQPLLFTQCDFNGNAGFKYPLEKLRYHLLFNASVFMFTLDEFVKVVDPAELLK